MGRRRVEIAAMGLLAAAALLVIGGCGHGTAAASDAENAQDEDLATFLRVLSEERRAQAGPGGGRAAGGDGRGGDEGGGSSLAITIERPLDFAFRHDEPPADVESPDRLRAEEVLLSFAMYAEAGRYDDQWTLLSDATRRAWLERVRREARRVGMETVEARIAGAEARFMWAHGFAAGGAHVDLAVRWRTRIDGERAVVEVLRGQDALDEIPLVRERGVWRLDLVTRIEQGDAIRVHAGENPRSRR